MEREFGALKGLMGVNGLTGDIMPDMGIGEKDGSCNTVKVAILGCGDGCEGGCSAGCKPGCQTCKNGNANG